MPMIKSQYDLLLLTPRQREVLVALVRQLSKAEVAQFSHVTDRIAKFDTAALLHMVEAMRSEVENGTNGSLGCCGIARRNVPLDSFA
jgi:hypothetical protein